MQFVSAEIREVGNPGADATTTPTGSCPRTSGARGSWYHSITSLPQIPHARISTSTSPSPGTGSSCSSTRISPAP